MRKLAAVVLGMVCWSGCTTNIYHVLKEENHFYVIPVGDENDPGEEGGMELPEGSVTVLTKGGTKYLVVPRRALVKLPQRAPAL